MLTPLVVGLLIVGYSVVCIVLGLLGGKETADNAHDFYTASRTTPWFVLVMTYIASMVSVWLFFAGPGGSYRGGFAMFYVDLSAVPLVMIIMYFVTTKVWLLSTRKNYITMADVFCDRYDSKWLRLIIGILCLATSLPYIVAVLSASGQAVNVVSGGAVSVQTGLVIMGVVMVFYVLAGGIRSVSWTDVVQGVIFFATLWIIAIVIVQLEFGSFGELFKQALATQPDWFSYPGPEEWAPYSLRFGYALSCAIGWAIMLPHVFVRAGLMAKDIGGIRKLLVSYPILDTLIWAAPVVIGISGLIILPGLSEADTELLIPYMVQNVIYGQLPVLGNVLLSLFFLGAIAVGMSTADSFLLVSASIVTEDILEKICGIKLTEKTRVLSIRLTIGIIGLVCILLALNPPELIWTLIMFAISLVIPLFPPLVAALYWRRATSSAAIISVIAGVIAVILTYKFGHGDNWNGVFGLLVSSVLMVVISYLTPQEDSRRLDLFYGALSEAEAEHLST